MRRAFIGEHEGMSTGFCFLPGRQVWTLESRTHKVCGRGLAPAQTSSARRAAGTAYSALGRPVTRTSSGRVERFVQCVLMLCFCTAVVAVSASIAKGMTAGSGLVRASLLLAGHGEFDVPTLERYGLVVTEVGPPNDEGQIYSFSYSVEMSSFGTRVVANNGIRSWRITFVSGELAGSVFQVRSNDQSRIEVTSAFGPLNGLQPGDLLLVERVRVRQPVRPTAP